MATYWNHSNATNSMNLNNGKGATHNNITWSKNLPDDDISAEKSPLQVFVKAKKRINGIFEQMQECVSDAAQFIDELHDCTETVDPEEQSLFRNYVGQVADIRKVLQRDHMKVVFFGRTSNGKSTVINAMLHDKILPSGIGHTTHCFCQVEGREGNEAYLLTEGSNEKLNVTNIKELANALCQKKLSESSLIRVFWPRERCSLLRDDVVFVDSPGADVSANLDDCINNHCKDADVFVFVLNSESTMTVAETSFFKKVSQQLSKPNIFILNNRWDASANEPESQEAVKFQHTQRCIDFLTNQLKVCANEEEARERVFFVSAREVLSTRIAEASENVMATAAPAEGFQARYVEFQKFERKFEECISQSAVKTKFQEHCSSGKCIARNMNSMLINILDRVKEQSKQKLAKKTLLISRIEGTGNEMKHVTGQINAKISQLVENVKDRVRNTLYDELWRLKELIDQYNSAEFLTDPIFLDWYKKELNAFVQKCLSSNLHLRLTSKLAEEVGALRNEMSERLNILVADDNSAEREFQSLLHNEPFVLDCTLQCDHLCADFREDLEFRFSLSIPAILQRFNAICNPPKRSLSTNTLRRQMHPRGTTVSTTSALGLDLALAQVARFAVSSFGSQCTTGVVLLTGGLLCKTIDWRIIFGIGALYGCVYISERLLWTNAAKERTFKEQYVRHATENLKIFSEFISSNCAYQVQQQLMRSLAALQRTVDTNALDMSEEIKTLESQLKVLNEHEHQINLMHKKVEKMAFELAEFEQDFILSI